jgi:hypothetical protein
MFTTLFLFLLPSKDERSRLVYDLNISLLKPRELCHDTHLLLIFIDIYLR